MSTYTVTIGRHSNNLQLKYFVMYFYKENLLIKQQIIDFINYNIFMMIG